MKHKTAVNQIDVYSYANYRAYIGDYYRARKLANAKFSLTSLANRVGLSKMAIKYLIDNKRHLADKNVSQFAGALGLQGKQAQYFEALVRFNKAKRQTDMNKHFRDMLEARGSPLQELVINDQETGVLQAWYYTAILEMSYFEGFRWDAEWIKRQLLFPVSLDKIRKAITFLETFKPSQSQESLRVPQNFKPYIYKSYCIQQIQLAAESVERLPPIEREIATLTISVDEGDYEQARLMVRDFAEKMRQLLASKKSANRVIQLNMQLFTTAKVEDSSHGDTN